MPVNPRPSVWLQDLTWQEVAEYLRQDRIIIVPIGSTEQHGPAGPLGLDSYVAITLAEDVAERTGVLVTPPMWFGDSSHHMGFPGTISLRTETLSALVRDVARSLVHHGFDRFLFINGHKGVNLPALNTTLRNLHEEEMPGVLFGVADPLHLARSVAGTIKETNEHHAGELEIGHILYRYPHLIRTDRLTSDTVDFETVFGGFVTPDLFGPGPDGVDIPWSSAEQREFAPTGSFSASASVSPEKGKAYHEHMVGRLVAFVEWLRRYDGPVGKRARR